MANSLFAGLNSLQVLPLWPFCSSQGLPAVPSWMQPVERLEQRACPALKRTKPSQQRVADFSIRSILAIEGSKGARENQEEPLESTVERSRTPLGWVRCAHFKPPAIPTMKRVGSPQPTSRSPRVPFSATQLGALESSFQQTRYLSTGQVRDLALLLGLTENRVKIWFQNRRARERREFLKQQPKRTVGMKGNSLQDQSPSGWR